MLGQVYGRRNRSDNDAAGADNYDADVDSGDDYGDDDGMVDITIAEVNKKVDKSNNDDERR